MSNINQLISNIQNVEKVQTYVHKNIEVRKTGRTASRTIGTKKFILHEVVPADSSMPQMADWVQDSELYIVEQK
jgi:hypothetical protein